MWCDVTEFVSGEDVIAGAFIKCPLYSIGFGGYCRYIDFINIFDFEAKPKHLFMQSSQLHTLQKTHTKHILYGIIKSGWFTVIALISIFIVALI